MASRGHAANYVRRDRVAEALARRLGITEPSAHQVLVGNLRFRVAEIVHAHADVGDYDRLEAWLLPVRAALQGIEAPELTPDLIGRAQRADALEDVAESDFLAHRSAAARRAWIQKLREQQAVSLQLLMALLRAEQNGQEAA